MTDFFIVSKVSLRPDPDDSSREIIAVDSNSIVARLHDLGPWAKVSFTDKSGKTFLGWVHADALAEVKATQIQLYDEPFGEAKTVVGTVVDVTVQLPPWKKVQVQLDDGSVIAGWIDTTGAVAPVGPSPSGPDHDQDDDLYLGPNEVYRPFLLEAEKLTDIDAATLAALVNAEADKIAGGVWNPKSTAEPKSSATGLTQFLASTWMAHATAKTTTLNQTCKKNGLVGPDNSVSPGREADVLNLRFDPRLSIIAAAEDGLANLNQLVKDGLVGEEVGDDEKAHYIYLAHHEGLNGARGYLKETSHYSFSQLAKQVGQVAAQKLVDKAGGDTTKAYRSWLSGYIDQHIQPSKFRKVDTPPTGGSGAAALGAFAGQPILVAELGRHPDLVKAIQWRLFELGYLDPPADGVFGPVTSWALAEFYDLNGIPQTEVFSKAVAQRLLNPVKTLPDIAPTGGWFDKVIAYMTAQKYFIARHPDCKNIVYLEGVDPNGTLNNNAPNKFNDIRVVFSIDSAGRPSFSDSIWEGTTEPGKFWTEHPMNPNGAARIAFNQYKSWVVGIHHPYSPNAHEALVQAAPVTVYRDLKKDYKREGMPETGLFAINQHWGYDMPHEDLVRSSAGCLVGRTKAGHKAFMQLVKSDPRYAVNHSYKFMAAVIPGKKLLD